jgi:hypothetical protein
MPLVLHSTRNSVYPEYLPIVKKSKVKVCNIYVITRLILSAQRTERHPSASHLKPIKKNGYFSFISKLYVLQTPKNNHFIFSISISNANVILFHFWHLYSFLCISKKAKLRP